MRDDEVARDLLQDTMLRAHRALGRLAPDANARAWLFRIATNAALNHVRDQARARRALDAHARDLAAHHREAPADDHAERRMVLWTKVATLPARQRVALTLRIADELDYAAIGARMGTSAETARANVYQATKKLRLEVAT